jgi:Ca-activated chloride channel family protein
VSRILSHHLLGRTPWIFGLATATGVALWLATGQPAHTQSAAAQPDALSRATPPTADSPAPTRIEDPYEAYASGLYDQSLQGFIDRQIERPEDPALALNIGSAQYQMKNFGEADRAFAAAALSVDPSLRAQALYNLGNSAYRQGKLEKAVELYKAALEIDPDDQDAKFNLEFVRDEIRRRHEEAQKRQQEQQQQDQSEEQQDQGGEQGDQQQPQQEPQQQDTSPDRDQDGLSDATERSGENPTDPDNPDTDGDGLADGAEDSNRDGRVDPGETDPNRVDSDGDGVPDAQDKERRRPSRRDA